MDSSFELYVVMNDKGEYFHRKGYGGYGKTWCPEAHKARVYTKIGQARAQITFFAKTYPKFPVPKLVRIIVERLDVIDETERTEKAKHALEKAEARRKLREDQRLLDDARERLTKTQKEIDRLSKKGKA